jgi:hypothetical protein
MCLGLGRDGWSCRQRHDAGWGAYQVAGDLLALKSRGLAFHRRNRPGRSSDRLRDRKRRKRTVMRTGRAAMRVSVIDTPASCRCCCCGRVPECPQGPLGGRLAVVPASPR